jgi:DNA modification methylase
MGQIYCADALEGLKKIKDKSVSCCITSPPYYGLRDYGIDGQIGLEPTPEEYISHLVSVFHEVWRVLRDDGTLWIIIGDSYAGSGKGA